MTTSRTFSVIVILTLITITVSGQEQLGLRLGNYSGINGAMLNPAFNVSSPLKWDVNIVALGLFAENNYTYIQDANLFKVIRNRDGLSFAGSNTTTTADGIVNIPSSGLLYDFTTGNRRKEAYVNAIVTGPSAMFHVKDHTFGVFFNMRSVTSTNRVPSSLSYYDLDALETGDVITVKPFKEASMVWSEVGLNYARNVINTRDYVLNVGGTFKFLQGYEGVFFQNHKETDIVLNQDFMTYLDAEVSYGWASGVSGYGEASEPYSLSVKGYGAALDLGAILYWKYDADLKNYRWKFGVSMLDFGKISFKRDAQKHEIDTDEAFDFVQEEYEDLQSFDDVFQVLSAQSLEDNVASKKSDKFGIWLPAGFSAFAEYMVTKSIFINATAVRRIRFFGPVAERENIWSITPRFEHRWFEVGVPLVLYNDKDPRMGAYFRAGPLTVGSDNLTSWFGKQNFSGSDIYLALKINPANISRKKNDQSKQKGVNPNDCFMF